MTIESQATVLLVDDVGRALDYYCGKLGFEGKAWEVNPRHYGYAWRDNCYLHFACTGEPPLPNGEMFDLYIYVDDVDALHDEFVARGVEIEEPPGDRDIGLRDFRLRDPHGYHLAFGKLLS